MRQHAHAVDLSSLTSMKCVNFRKGTPVPGTASLGCRTSDAGVLWPSAAVQQQRRFPSAVYVQDFRKSPAMTITSTDSAAALPHNVTYHVQSQQLDNC